MPAATKSKRVAFTFDERSLAALTDMTERGHYASMADTVRESLRVVRALQRQAKQGYTEVKVTNPETGEERIIVIPHLESISED